MLTDEDRKWFEARLDADKQEYQKLLERYVRVTFERMDADKQEMMQRFQDVDRRFDTERAHTDERIEALETKLLAGFHKWASPIDSRIRTHSSMLRTLDLEFEALRDRVQKLEDERERPH